MTNSPAVIFAPKYSARASFFVDKWEGAMSADILQYECEYKLAEAINRSKCVHGMHSITNRNSALNHQSFETIILTYISAFFRLDD